MGGPILLLMLANLAGNPGLAGQAEATDPRHFCAQIGNDDTLRTPPGALAPAIAHLFGMNMSEATRTTYFRCAGGKVLVCWVGANLACGKADRRRTLAPADQWCHAHPNESFIPMVVTGHDTAYVWRCRGRDAVPSGPAGKIDARGFFARHWKVLQ